MDFKEIKEKLLEIDSKMVKEWKEISSYQYTGIEQRIMFLEDRFTLFSGAILSLLTELDNNKNETTLT